MKKLLVAAVILLAAAACGASSASTSSLSPYRSSGLQAAPNGKSAATTVPGGTTTAPDQPAPLATPVAQGPLVIRQAQLTITVASGTFDSRLTDVRHLVELEQGFIAGTDAQVNPQASDDNIRTGVITFMVPADRF